MQYDVEKQTGHSCGRPAANDHHAEQIADMALEMLAKMPGINRDLGLNLQVRIGIHSGEIVAGVIGKSKFAYDMWGDTVNTASRMESAGVPDKIQISSATYHLLHDKGYAFKARDEIDVKGKGKMKAFILTGRSQRLMRQRQSRDLRRYHHVHVAGRDHVKKPLSLSAY